MKNYRLRRGIKPEEIEALTERAITAKTIRRLLDPENEPGAHLESMDQIAHFFKVETHDLLTPREPDVQGEAMKGKERPTQETIPAFGALKHKVRRKV